MKHKRTKACAIPKITKVLVYKRDWERCIFCGAPGLPEAHVVPRSQGGLGVPQNIITVCRQCHDRLDNSVNRQQMLEEAKAYLEKYYPGWSADDYVFDKDDKDKATELIDIAKISTDEHQKRFSLEKELKDRADTPEGFYYL